MKISSRSPLPSGTSRSFFLLRFSLLFAPVLAALAFVTAPASAHVVEVGGTKFGVQRHSETLFEPAAEPQTFANASGNPVLHQSSTYAIFWDPDYRYLDPWTEVIDQFFQNMGTASGSLASVFAVDTQYTDRTDKPAYYHSAFYGSYADKVPYPSSVGCKDPNPWEVPFAITCLSDKQVREQLESFILREKLPKGMETIYYVLTPPGVTVCTDEGPSASHCSSDATANSFCSYHAAITPTNPTAGDKNTILYGVIPWVAGSAGDPLLNVSNQPPAFQCQDGGFDPSTKPIAEEKEHPKISSKEEEEKRLSAEKKENEELSHTKNSRKKESSQKRNSKAKRKNFTKSVSNAKA